MTTWNLASDDLPLPTFSREKAFCRTSCIPTKDAVVANSSRKLLQINFKSKFVRYMLMKLYLLVENLELFFFQELVGPVLGTSCPLPGNIFVFFPLVVFMVFQLSTIGGLDIYFRDQIYKLLDFP